MACKFSFYLSFTDAAKENDVGVFQSNSGDIYRVKYKSNVCRDLLLTVEWTIPKQILFTVKLYSTSFKRCFSSKGIIINGRKAFVKLRGAFNVSNSRNYKVLCVINLIPYIKFNECNKVSSESFNDSCSNECEVQQSSIDLNNVIYEETKCRTGNLEECTDVKRNIAIKVDMINKSKNSHAVKEEVYQESVRKKSVFQVDDSALADEMLMEESGIMSSENVASNKSKNEELELSKNSSNLNSHDRIKKKNRNKNAFERVEIEKVDSEQNLEINKNTSENKFEENIISSNSDKQIIEFMPSDGTQTRIDTIEKIKPQDAISIKKFVTIDNYSAEISANLNAINICDNSKSDKTLSEDYSSMEVDLPDLSSDDQPVFNDEENLLCNSDSKVSEEFLTSIDSNSNQDQKIELQISPDYNHRSYLNDNANLIIDFDDMEANLILKSDDIPKQNNLSDEKYVTSLSNHTIGTHSKCPDLTKNYNIDSNISILKSDSSPIQKTSNVIKDDKMKNIVMHNHKSGSTILPASKTKLVFQTLMSKLSEDDWDIKSIDANRKKINTNNSPESETDDTNVFPVMESELKGLSMDMLDLLTSGDMADAVITNGEKALKVHRAILSSRSSVLKELFIKHREDNIEYRAVVHIPCDILEDVIIFLYVGLIYIKSTKMAQDLHEVAERYRINDLIDICSKYISK